MKRPSNIRFLILTIGAIAACEKDDTVLRQQLIDKQVSERLEIFFQAEKRRCRVKVLEEASTLADSILRANPVFISLDSLQRPPIPSRPMRPEFERKTDSIKIEPIIPKQEN